MSNTTQKATILNRIVASFLIATLTALVTVTWVAPTTPEGVVFGLIIVFVIVFCLVFLLILYEQHRRRSN
jgi:L-lactate permease